MWSSFKRAKVLDRGGFSPYDAVHDPCPRLSLRARRDTGPARFPVRHLRRLLVDVAPLRESAAFRRLWVGGGLSAVGGQMTNYAVMLQVFLLTRSSLSVGLVGLAIALPSIGASLAGGAILDTVDRRTTALVGTSLQVLVSASFAAQAFANLRDVPLLYLLVVVQSAVGGVNAPARRTFMPRLLRREQLAAGAALQALVGYTSMLTGPALAGVVTATVGLRNCYAIDAASFLFSLYAIARLPAMPPEGGHRPGGVRAVADGLRFVARTRAVLGAFLADSSATFLGMPIALFPAINAERFGGSPETLGLLSTAVAVGGLLGSSLSGPVGRISRQGLGMLVAGGTWGLALAAFGLSDTFAVALVFLAVAGAADVSAVVLRTAIVQGVTPDAVRGRVSATEHAVGAGVPQLGNFRAGILGSLTSPTIGVVTGGLSVVAGALAIGWGIPAFVGFRRPGSEEGALLVPVPGEVEGKA